MIRPSEIENLASIMKNRDQKLRSSMSKEKYVRYKWQMQIMGWSLFLILAGYIAYISHFGPDYPWQIALFFLLLSLMSIGLIIHAIIRLVKLRKK